VKPGNLANGVNILLEDANDFTFRQTGKNSGFYTALSIRVYSRLFAVSFSHIGLRAGRVNAKFGIRNFSEGGVRIAQRFLLGKFEIRNVEFEMQNAERFTKKTANEHK